MNEKINVIIKRSFDILASALGLLILSPLLLILALLVRLNLGSPVFFVQERPGLHEKIFRLYKFRSMRDAVDKNGSELPDEQRLGRFGKLLRASSLDELPELFNVLKGEMSLVGPRPERVEHVVRYTEMIPEFRFRHKVKGGLTGYAQVYGKYNTEALDKLKLDLMYIMNYSLLLDIQIIFETVKILLRKESTEGFSQENAREMHDAGVKR